jgi:hypothetical protein
MFRSEYGANDHPALRRAYPALRRASPALPLENVALSLVGRVNHRVVYTVEFFRDLRIKVKHSAVIG